MLSFVSLWMLVYFRCRITSREMARGFENIGGARTMAQPWALWFRANCAVSPLAIFTEEMCLFAIGALLFVSSVSMRLWVLAVVCLPSVIWSGWMMAASVCFADTLWIFVLAERLIFGVATVAIACASRKDEVGFDMTEGVWSALVLILLTQLGLWRQGSTQSHSLSVGFFVVIAMAIAALSFMASSSNTGLNFASREDGWCPAGSEHCTEFEFPLSGSLNHSYEFCGLSWPMGMGDTVSDRCEDSRLSLVDFGQISTIAGLIPNTTKVDQAVAKYLPGWTIKKIQTYNLTAGTTTTFIHLIRGSTSVIAVRGTSSAVEVLQDLNLWMRIGFLQLARRIGPSCYSTREILKAFTANRTELMGKSFQDLIDYTRHVNANRTNRSTQKLYITGHSLGGGLATAVGAIVNIPAVTFSAPGLEATSAILTPSPQEEVLTSRGVNVVPRKDVVPMVDVQTGSTLRIECPLNSTFQCHRLDNTMCELLAACGDGGGRPVLRGYNRSCRSCLKSGQSPPDKCGTA